MPRNSSPDSQLRAACSVAEMARMVGLSRARFYELISEGVFLPPVYTLRNRRPFFTREMQQTNLAVRREQVGINGEYILFYERHTSRSNSSHSRRSRRGQRRDDRHADLIRGLRSLGVESVTAEQIDEALAVVCPEGTEGFDHGTVLRRVHRHLRSERSARSASGERR